MDEGFWTDESWWAACRQIPMLNRVTPHLPPAAPYAQRDALRRLSSSYREQGYDRFFYGLVRALRPSCCVEVGVLEGFSLLAMAAALRDNARAAGLDPEAGHASGHTSGHVTAYDLFEQYPYRHAVAAGVNAACAATGLDPYVTLREADVNEASRRHARIDLLHIDISNDGETYRQQFTRWARHVTGAIVFEGGSRVRDEVEWMRTYRRPGTSPAVETLRERHPDWRFAVIEPFPSITVAVRSAFADR